MIEASISLRFAETLLRGRSLSRVEMLSIEPLLEEMVEYIADRWPVGNHTGVHSRDLWRYTVSLSPPSVTLINDADYAEHVHRAGNPIPLEETLIPTALNRYGPEIRRTLTAAILSTNKQRASAPVLDIAGPRRVLRNELATNLRRMGVAVRRARV